MRPGIGWKILAGYLAISLLVGLSFGALALVGNEIVATARSLNEKAQQKARILAVAGLVERAKAALLQELVLGVADPTQFDVAVRLVDRELERLGQALPASAALLRIAQASERAIVGVVRDLRSGAPGAVRRAAPSLVSRFAALRALLDDLSARYGDLESPEARRLEWLGSRGYFPGFLRRLVENGRRIAAYNEAVLASHRLETAFWERTNALLNLSLDPGPERLRALESSSVPPFPTLTRPPELAPLLTEHAAAMRRFDAFVRAALERYRSGGPAAYEAFVRQQFPPVFEAALDATTPIRSVLEVERGRVLDEIELLNASTLSLLGSLARLVILGLLVGVLLAALLTRHITGPLDALAEAMNRVRSGDLDVRLDPRGRRDEVGQMVAAFNQMVAELAESRRRLETYQEGLEQMVAERTRQLERTRAQLVQSEKLAALGELVAGVAHELNNPLTSVIGYAQLLESGELGPEEAQRAVGIVLQEADRARRIVQNLLTFARRRTHERNPVDINAAIEQTVALRRYELERSGVEFVLQLAPDLPKIYGDLFQLQQVFLNVINNAAQAMPEGRGRLEIRTTHRDGRVVIEIADTGTGIPPEYLHRIFDPFFTTKDVGQGTGLGLSISYGIVRDHGGEIYAENRPEGGARFTIELPVESPPD
jgi:signal transduction histidine kinase